ncbi:hypothetical protein SAY86_024307 [Trapa natans]|uniref:RING-type E3 ubiquitin transferase n=1 Tax=Trapa natans TaxID=22666 RepID=A0AAN7M6F8_TRANT|nr:hypothetical protein SAY86_024307 [Trapa natans]
MSFSAEHSSSSTAASAGSEVEGASDVNAPLLAPRQGRPTRSSSLATLLGRATGQRGPSMLVRETAARELEQRRVDWGYSLPMVALDMVWNAAFVVVSVVMLSCTVNEQPSIPIRLWICGYALQCIVHVVLVWLEYRRRTAMRTLDEEWQQDRAFVNNSDDEEAANRSDRLSAISAQSSAAKCCESINTMASLIWWIVGFYWIVSGGNTLLHDAPRLYWYGFHLEDSHKLHFLGLSILIRGIFIKPLKEENLLYVKFACSSGFFWVNICFFTSACAV